MSDPPEDGHIEVHRQRCQACSSMELRDIIVREVGKPMAIYVRCAKCGELVAFYELQRYYHHGKGIESFLRAHGVGAADSGRAWLDDFKRVQKRALEGFERALERLRRENKDV
ncbi:MAG TPA: hypothetical protein DDW52_00820 [Planctomycetaceae bacterium]|nr:hypothetical protein [Planctomycetaceae bacterium]